MKDSTAICTVLERKDLGDDTEVVLCDRGPEVSPGRYVTWIRSLKDGATHWGQYYSNVMDAGVSFLRRTSQ